MARRRKGREVNGILLLDKPRGMTSNFALQKVKRLFNASKAGHTGILDPMATGLLPICLGEATKFSRYLLDSDKQYLGTCKLGQRTDTADAEGEVIETRDVPELNEALVNQVLGKFIGKQQQVPPMYSALKVDGQPLYKLAREGKEIERKARDIEIYQLSANRIENDEIDILVGCSKGTYIRTLSEDIGEALGCGAHLSALRRTQTGPFDLKDAVTFAELEKLVEQNNEGNFEALDALLLPMDYALSDWPSLILSQNTAYYLCQGQAVMVPKAPSEGMVRLYEEGSDSSGQVGRFLGVGEIRDDGMVAPSRLVNTQSMPSQGSEK